MSRIISYPYDNDIKDGDAWIGTEVSSGQTKQYTAEAVANYLNINGKISIGGQMTYQYVQNPLQGAGTFSITSGGLDNVPFANITALTLSITDKVGQNVVAFLDYLVGSDILISKQNEVSSFGHYGVVSYVVSPANPAFYNLVVDLKGSNGSMNFLDIYEAINFTLASEIVGSYTFNVDSDNGTTTPIQNNDTINFGSSNITVSNVGSAISFNLPVTGVTAGAYTTANITVDAFGRVTEAASGTSGPGGTGTTNFVTKWTNGTTLGDSIIFDNGTNVGIGTTSPARKLNVAGDLGIASSVNALRIGGNGVLGVLNGLTRLSGTGGISGGIMFTPNNDNTERMRIDFAGNVGIGTTSPTDPLTVTSTSNSKGIRLNYPSTNSTVYPFYVGNAAETAYVRANSNAIAFKRNGGASTIKTEGSSNNLSLESTGNFIVKTGNPINTQMTILANGKVGIGTTSPAEKFSVAGNIAVQNGNQIMLGGATGDTKIGKLYNVSGVISLDGEGTRSIRLGSTTNGEVMRVDNINKKIGIGTTSPSAKLEVRKGGTIAAQGDTDLIVQDSTAASSTSQVQILGGATGFSNLYFSDTSAYNVGGFIYNHSSNYLATNVNGSEKMRITSAGNVGIGTTSPDTLLNLEGVKNKSIITLGSTTNDSGWSAGDKIGGIDFYSADGSGAGSGVKGSISYIASTTGSGGVTAMTFSTASGASNNVERMRIDTSGNVGIGTTSPDSKLDVSDTSPIITINATAISAHGIEFKQSNTLDAFIKQTPSSGEFAFNVGRNAGWGGNFKFSTDTYDSYRIQKDLHRFYILGSEKMRIHSNGNVGIGETNPTLGKLQVDGVSTTIAINSSTNTDSTLFMLRNGGANGIALLKVRDGGHLSFDTGANGAAQSEKMRISANGNVGIGTTNPSQKLEVDGEVLSDGYRLAAMQTAPAARNSTGTLGEIIIDGNHLYVCYATNSWSRVALETAW